MYGIQWKMSNYAIKQEYMTNNEEKDKLGETDQEMICKRNK